MPWCHRGRLSACRNPTTGARASIPAPGREKQGRARSKPGPHHDHVRALARERAEHHAGAARMKENSPICESTATVSAVLVSWDEHDCSAASGFNTSTMAKAARPWPDGWQRSPDRRASIDTKKSAEKRRETAPYRSRPGDRSAIGPRPARRRTPRGGMTCGRPRRRAPDAEGDDEDGEREELRSARARSALDRPGGDATAQTSSANTPAFPSAIAIHRLRAVDPASAGITTNAATVKRSSTMSQPTATWPSWDSTRPAPACA